MAPQKRRASDRSFSGPLSSRIRHARRMAQLTQAGLAKAMGVGPSAVAQWELPRGTSPTINHLIELARLSGASFEWLSTGRGHVAVDPQETPAIESSSFTTDAIEDRMLMAFRRMAARKRETFVRWMEDFF